MSNDNYTRRNRDRSRDTIQHYGTSGNRHQQSNEQRAKEEAYQEYLRLRENRNSRGSYVKDDTLYGEYFPAGDLAKQSAGRRGSVDNTAYGRSDMRQNTRNREQDERERYLEERAKVRDDQRIARPGRRNKADEDKLTRAEKKQQKKAGKKGKKGKKSGRPLKIALIAVLILVLGIGGLIAAGLTVVKSTLDNVGRIELDPELIGIDPQVDAELSNYRNIALLGIDARDMSSDEGVRSDAIIVASINKETSEIKMFSVYRDTLLDIGDDVGLDKVTHAYYYGGPTKVLYSINKNLDLNVKEVVVVNWKAVADTVDALGGIDVEIQDSEINEMNKYIKDTYENIGGSDKQIKEAGMQTLNGNQAVTYARIRKDALTGDYRRNERMKIVVKAAFDKAKQMDVKTLKKISNEILPEIKTNMSTSDMLGMLLKLNSYSMTDSVGWPYEVRGWSNGGWYGPPVTLSSNVIKLHEEFFAQQDYVPTENVQSISERISATTGYY